MQPSTPHSRIAQDKNNVPGGSFLQTVLPRVLSLEGLMLLLSSIGIVALLVIGNTRNNLATSPLPSFSPNNNANNNGAAFGVLAAPTVARAATRAVQVSSVSSIVTKALAFKSMLTTAQQATLQQTFTNTLAQKWSNLPCGPACRNGIEFGTLSAAQLAAAQEVIKAAAGTAVSEGYSEFTQVMTADSLLGTVSSGGGMGGGMGSNGNYSKNFYFIAFLNTPSATGPWMLQYGGHHFAANISFNGGNIVGCTPVFEGVEPITWTNNLPTGPLQNERDAMAAMLASLSASQLTTARLSGTFNDIILGANEDGKFPATKLGLQVSTLSTAQQTLIMAAMSPWLNDMEATPSAALRSIYQNELSRTYISYSGAGTSGNASSFLTAHANYVRIDGPSVWIEFVCQTGITFPTQIHYHSVWRDHTRDYGNYLANTSLTGTTGVAVIDKSTNVPINVYPTPTHSRLNMTLPSPVVNATMTIVDMTGKIVMTKTNVAGSTVEVNVEQLSRGAYMMTVQNASHFYSGKFTKQ